MPELLLHLILAPGKGVEAVVMKIRVVLESSADGGFTVYAPSLPGCISEGDTKEEALKNIKEAIALYVEVVEDEAAVFPDRQSVEVAI